jgi:hypothetical protein
MTRLSRISSNRALLVLCALGFLGANSSLVAAGELGQKGGKARTIDRRQPLPSTYAARKNSGTQAAPSKGFAARFIQGGTSAFDTNYKKK